MNIRVAPETYVLVVKATALMSVRQNAFVPYDRAVHEAMLKFIQYLRVGGDGND